MKSVLTFLFLSLFSPYLMAASTTIHPFSFEFYVMEDRFDVQPQVQLSCRYEKLVAGDSSEYYTETKKIDLSIDKVHARPNVYYKIALKDKKYLEVKGAFKPTKECVSNLIINFVDKNYTIGWAGQMNRPVAFMLSSNAYFKAGETIGDFSKIIEMIDFKNLDFYYKSVPGLQVNIWMTADGVKLPLSPISTAIDAETNMPYRLETF